MRKEIWLIILLMLAIVPAQAAISGYDPRYIEIDGNVTPGDGTCLGSPCTDWLAKQLDGTLTGIPMDGIGNADGSILSPDSILSAGSMLPKQDITRIWLSNNKEYFYLAEERRANNGNSGWHVFMTKIAPESVLGQPVIFDLSEGDLEIQICFPRGSAPEQASIVVRRVTTPMAGVWAADLWSSGVFDEVSAAGFAINVTPVPALVGALDSKGNVTTTYDTACFAEAAISLASVGISPCGTTAFITVITRSSCSLTSDLKDIHGPAEYTFGGPELSVDEPVRGCTTDVSFSATASKGSPPYTFKWYDNGSLVPFHTATIPSAPFTDAFTIALPAGPHDVRVEVTDGADCGDARALPQFVVYDPLGLSMTKPVAPDCTNSATLSATASQGLGPYHFQWYDNDTLIRDVTKLGPGPTTDSFSYTFAPGDHTISVKLTDERGCTKTDSYGPFPVYGLLSLALTKPVAPDCTNSATLSATADKGLGPYHFQWYDNGAPIRDTSAPGPGPTTDSFSYTFTPGDHTISVHLTDARGCEANDESGPFTVYGLLDVALSHSTPVCDEAIVWTATPSGGNGPFTYEWTLDGSVVNGTGPTYQYGPDPDCTTHVVSVKVTDSRPCTDSDTKNINQTINTTFPTP